MPGKYAKRKKKSIIPLLILAAALLLGGLLFLFKDRIFPSPADPTLPQPGATTLPVLPTETTGETVPPTTVPPETEPQIIEASASFTVTGDLLMHRPVFETCWDAEKGDWVFDYMFTHVAPYIQAADYAVANLETTLCGPDNGYAYSGNPLFNCPDGIAPATLNAGFDMLLTANNHCYDTRMVGIRRTLDILAETGLESLGTQHTAEDPNHKVIEVNGIRVGMTAFAAETKRANPSVPALNAIQCHPSSVGMINTFNYGMLDAFYKEIGAQFEAMKAEGAEAIVVYLHWGEEYLLEPTDLQKKIAQQLCDMGVDVIVGGHPHVIEPVDLLTSTLDENQKTLIIYSTGNAVSNQRIHEMRMKSGHTEDGILFHFTLVRYIDGTVAVRSAGCTPTWVNMIGNKEKYYILPLDASQQDQWAEMFQLEDSTFAACLDSYDRTMELVGPGLEKAQAWFEEAYAEKVLYLSDPSRPWETEPTKPVTEPVTEPSEPPVETSAPTEPTSVTE